MRTSVYGFYCSDCGRFVHQGYDNRDKISLPNDCAVCTKCGPRYEDKKSNKQINPTA